MLGFKNHYEQAAVNNNLPDSPRIKGIDNVSRWLPGGFYPQGKVQVGTKAASPKALDKPCCIPLQSKASSITSIIRI